MDPHPAVSRALLIAAVILAAASPTARARRRVRGRRRAGEDHGRRGHRPPAVAAPRPRSTEICIDREIADRLAVKRKRRGAVDRLFVKGQRHELTASGGYYSSDLFSGTWVLGGAYTFHMTEQTAVEFAWWLHPRQRRRHPRHRGRARRGPRPTTFARVIFAESLLLWSPVYGKLRFGGTIVHFDIHLDAGVGVVDSSTSRGAAGVAGFGMKFFSGTALAFRIDARSHVFRQELLDERFLVNDVSVTAGLSLFLPFSN